MNEIFEYDVFISFASEDEDIVRPLWQNLCLSGLRVFWSDITLKEKVAQNWLDVIQQAVVNSRHFILVCTPNSMSSNWVKDEYQTFYSQCYQQSEGKRLLILKIEKNYSISSLPPFLKKIQATNSNEEIIKLLGGTNIDKLKRENKSLLEKLDKLTDENNKYKEQVVKLKLIIDKITSGQLPNGNTEEAKSKIYLKSNIKLFDKPGGLQKGPVFPAGQEFEYTEINKDGWIQINIEQEHYWIKQENISFKDPKIYFTIIGKSIQGYLVGHSTGPEDIGNIKYLTLIDKTLGTPEIEIKRIKSIKIIGKPSIITIETVEGDLYEGTTRIPAQGLYGKVSRAKFVSKSVSINLDEANDITLERIDIG